MTMASLIDPSKTVYPEQWVVSLVAKPKGKNPEHAFIIVEGLLENGEKFAYRRYDFVVQQQTSPGMFQKVAGLVVVKEANKTLAEFSQDERADYFWTMLMKDAQGQEGCVGASWILTAEEANQLHQAILTDKAKYPPLDYQISGQFSLLGISSPELKGHNCYTWACSKLLTIPNQNIQHDDRLQFKFADFIAARSTRHLYPTHQQQAETISPGSTHCGMM